jgi:hypothetical protein
MFQYEVLRQPTDIVGKFEFQELDRALNAFASQGWRFASVATGYEV